MENNNKNTPEYWDKYWEEMPESKVDSKITLFDKFIDWAIEGLDKSSEILEVGAGTGKTAAFIANKGYSVIATDYSQKAVSIMKKQYSSIRSLLILESSLEEATIQKRAYDAVIAQEILEHYQMPSEPVMRLWNCLKPGGRLIFTVPDKLGWMAEAEYHYTHFDYDLICRVMFRHFKEVRFYRGDMYGAGIWGVAIK